MTTKPSREEKAALRSKRLPPEESVFSISTRMSISGFFEAIRVKDLLALLAQNEIDESFGQVLLLRTHNRYRVSYRLMFRGFQSYADMVFRHCSVRCKNKTGIHFATADVIQ